MKNLNERSVRILASLGLILTTMIWGFAFVVMKNSVDLIPPTYLLAIRFSMSAVLLALLFHKNLFGSGPPDDPLRRDPGNISLPVLPVPDLRSEIHDGQQKRLYHDPVCDHCTVSLLDRQQKETDRAKYRCSVYRSHRSRTFISAGRPHDQFRRFSDTGVRSDVRSPYGIYR